jgi:hypothetical protein
VTGIVVDIALLVVLAIYLCCCAYVRDRARRVAPEIGSRFVGNEVVVSWRVAMFVLTTKLASIPDRNLFRATLVSRVAFYVSIFLILFAKATGV